MENTSNGFKISDEDLKLRGPGEFFGKRQHGYMKMKIGKIFGATKNAVIGALYRDKVKDGYVPPQDSKYTGPKNL